MRPRRCVGPDQLPQPRPRACSLLSFSPVGGGLQGVTPTQPGMSPLAPTVWPLNAVGDRSPSGPTAILPRERAPAPLLPCHRPPPALPLLGRLPLTGPAAGGVPPPSGPRSQRATPAASSHSFLPSPPHPTTHPLALSRRRNEPERDCRGFLPH